ncbi:hypothetical protein [Endozoicomonas sp. SESOKO1]|uniref:hypothetical protein n=1 Tax=Endozoicomonas sp. SESOKO1 TaxID=2828742 RepID=UPI00214920E6|nr:hypothetical protein [Endozoicomonas sp. SESOKO1]
MNIGNMATGLAGVGLTAAVSLNTAGADSSSLTKWRTRAVMALSGTVGTSLSLVQCLREGRNVSAKTVATLATNACVLAYSYLQPWADITTDLMIYNSEEECYAEFLRNEGEMSMPQCQPYLHKAVFRKVVLEKSDNNGYRLSEVARYDWKE